ncbi:alpha/beta-hydrolase [Aureobasidium pullulans]|uniref:Alpha/beta-hydrolase n=1 Tax=Aureobasidium pullulans TaxID=5580 RepID=A0A4S8ZWG2_AURPU|nr:alpha/beta-hydrolase [Aureobasidium pullulans]THY16842.1 alpha/beta-hydrolase [Aureobasidium pullulans]
MAQPDELAEDLLSKRSNPRDYTPLPAEFATLSCRIRYFFLVWMVKITIAVQLTYLRLLHPTPIYTRPNFVKSYTCRPSLPVRVFMPKSRLDHPGDPTSLPLYISVHGGAFATCDASIDDNFCRSWCERTGMVVVGLNYRKAPLHRFPIPVLDIAAVARAVIDDETLNIDKSRVVLAGFSAGGKLALTSCQLPELQGRIAAAISYFPIVDWSAPPHAKWAERLYTEKASESLNTAGPALDWAYVPAGQDRKAKLLSPCYAEREELPKWVCLVGAQHDMLCRESRDMIYSLADIDVPETGWDQGWERGTYKWMLAMGVRHGFTDDFRKKRGRSSEKRRQVCEEVYASVHKWLDTKVFASKSKL